MLPDQSLNPMMLKASSRGSHAARKHLLLATVPELPQLLAAMPGHGAGDQQRLQWLRALVVPAPAYVSIGPEAAFGHGKV